MRARRFMAVALVGSAVVFGAAGCGDDSSSNDDPAPAASTPAAPATETQPSAAPTADVAAGKGVFTENCGSCHTLADAGTSGAVGPNLDDAAPSVEKVVSQVTNGGGSMPAFGDKLSAQEIQDLAAYVADSAG